MQQLDVDDLKALREAGTPHVLLDVREDEEWEIARIAGAVHIPMGQVPARLVEIPRDQLIVCQCHHGMRSAQVAQFLLQNGYQQVANLSGGIHAWSQLVDPSVPPY